MIDPFDRVIVSKAESTQWSVMAADLDPVGHSLRTVVAWGVLRALMDLAPYCAAAFANPPAKMWTDPHDVTWRRDPTRSTRLQWRGPHDSADGVDNWNAGFQGHDKTATAGVHLGLVAQDDLLDGLGASWSQRCAIKGILDGTAEITYAPLVKGYDPELERLLDEEDWIESGSTLPYPWRPYDNTHREGVWLAWEDHTVSKGCAYEHLRCLRAWAPGHVPEPTFPEGMET